MARRLIGLCLLAPAPGQALAADALEALNATARAGYSEARATLLARQGPVIFLSGDEVVLLRGKERTAVNYMPAIYHRLKDVCHAPLAICAMLTGYGEDALSEAQLAALRRLREAIAGAAENLEGFSPELLPRQKKMLAEGGAFLDQVIKQGRCSRADLVAFCRGQRPLIQASLTDGAKVQIDALHRQVAKWRSGLPAEEWARLKVVVTGTQMPRRDQLGVQYFAKLLDQKGEGSRIVYAEAIFDEQRALNLLGTHLLDREIGIAFFDDPQRMSRDLLGDAAAAYLKDMKLD